MKTLADRLEQQLRERGAQKIDPPGYVGVVIDALDVREAIAVLRLQRLLALLDSARHWDLYKSEGHH